MNLEKLRSRLNIFRLSIWRHSGVKEKDINCFIEIDGERYEITDIKVESTDSGRYFIKFKGE